MQKLNIFNKLGLWFFYNIDKRGLIFNSLKNQKIWVRYIIYTLLLISTFFSITYLNQEILSKLSSYDMVTNNINIFQLLFTSIKYIVLLIEATIIFYESIYKYNLEEILNIKEEINKNKKPLLSRWYIRVLLYFIVFFILSQILYLYILNSNLEDYVAISNFKDNEIVIKFNSGYEKVLFEQNLSFSIDNAFKKFYSFFFITIFIYEISLLRKKYDN